MKPGFVDIFGSFVGIRRMAGDEVVGRDKAPGCRFVLNY
jgi:hypothetical protein